MKDYVVAVIGAGPAGAMAAYQLATAGLQVLHIDRGGKGRLRAAETISPEARRLLGVSGLWERLPKSILTPCQAIVTAWEKAEPSSRSFITNPYGCAWHVDRSRFDPWLTAEAEEAGAVKLTGIARTICRNEDRWSFDVHKPGGQHETVVAEYLVVATGRSRSPIGLGRRMISDSLCVIGGWSTPARDAGSTLLVEAVPNGWWYSTPSTEGRFFAGWVTDAALLTNNYSCREAMRNSLPHASLTRARLAAVPTANFLGAETSWMTPSSARGWIAIGDASLARDPLSGDGLAYALRSAREGAATVLGAISGEKSAWSTAITRAEARLKKYLAERSLIYEAGIRRWPAERFWRARAATPLVRPALYAMP